MSPRKKPGRQEIWASQWSEPFGLRPPQYVELHTGFGSKGYRPTNIPTRFPMTIMRATNVSLFSDETIATPRSGAKLKLPGTWLGWPGPWPDHSLNNKEDGRSLGHEQNNTVRRQRTALRCCQLKGCRS